MAFGVHLFALHVYYNVTLFLDPAPTELAFVILSCIKIKGKVSIE